MRKMVILMSFTIMASAEAFHSVTEILPDGKLLICKDYNQVKKGNIVEVYSRVDPRSSSDFEMKKTSEFKLPAAGEKIKLTHKDFHSSGKNSVAHSQELGQATIVSENLEGVERHSIIGTKTRFAKTHIKTHKMTKEEALKIQEDCIVAVTGKDLQMTEKAAVNW